MFCWTFSDGERAFDHEAAIDDIGDAADFIFVEFARFLHRVNIRFREDVQGIDRANAVDIPQADANLFIQQVEGQHWKYVAWELAEATGIS